VKTNPSCSYHPPSHYAGVFASRLGSQRLTAVLVGGGGDLRSSVWLGSILDLADLRGGRPVDGTRGEDLLDVDLSTVVRKLKRTTSPLCGIFKQVMASGLLLE